MKKYLLLILIYCWGVLAAKSQTTGENTPENTPHNGQDPCERPTPIVTNPFAPQNTEWFSQRNRFNWFDYVTFHNNFKARIPYFDNSNIYGGGNNSIRYFTNPFFDKDEDYLSHINLKNNPPLFFQLGFENDFNNLQWLVDEMDITSVEHGWELLWKFDGYDADGITPIAGGMSGVNTAANFILYNRYTGMLRWFTAPKVIGTSYNELESLIEFADENQIASLFRNYNGLDQALDKPTVVLRAASPAKTSFSIEHFSMADFNISYDPCVCYFDSRLSYKLNGITSANIDLYGRLEGTSQMLNASDAINSDRLLSVYKDRKNSQFPEKVKNGLLEYKNYDKLLKDFEKLENKSNIFDDVYDANQGIAKIAEIGYDLAKGVKEYKTLYSIKTYSKLLGFASMPFKTDKKTKSPPMLIQAQMSLTGQLNSSTPLNGFNFDMFTPGSYNTDMDLSKLNSINNNERFLYPVYNQAMGLYAMLKTPNKAVARAGNVEETVKAVMYVPTYNSEGRPNGSKPVDSTTRSVQFSPREAFKLTHDLSYTFNPNAQINVDATTLEAAWMVEFEKAANNDYWHLTSPNMSKTYDYVNDQGKYITVYSSEFMPIECISQFVALFDFALTDEAKRTTLMDNTPGNGNQDFMLSAGMSTHITRIFQERPRFVNTFLKKNILYRYNKPDMSGLNDVVHFETHKFNIEGNTNNPSILESPGIAILSAPSELVIGTRHFTAPETIFAWDKITINGKISSDPGVEVIIQSAGEIIVEPDAEIHSEVLLLIDKPTVCNAARIQPTAIDKAYCENKTQYKANTSLTKTGDVAPTQPTNKINQSVIYPNPATTGNFTVATKLEKDSYIQVAVFDLTGKLLHQQQSAGSLSKGVHQTVFNDLLLEQGMYLVEVETNEGKSIHRLMIK